MCIRDRQKVDDEVQAKLFELTERDQRLLDLTKSLYDDFAAKDYQAASLTDKDRAYLQDELGWYGELALHPEEGNSETERDEILQQAKVLTIVLMLFVGGLFLLFLFGIGCGIIYIVLIIMGAIRSKIKAPGENGGLYAETFALWLLFYFGGSFVLMFVPIPPDSGMLIQLVIFFGSLSVLIWPVLRGVSFGQVRRDIGWTLDSPWEPFYGFLNYSATLPLLIVGALLAVVVAAVISGFTAAVAHFMPETVEPVSQFVNPQGPTHPIVFELGGSSIWTKIQLILLACVAAPVVEETMFRGVLYRHLRDASAGMRIGASVLFSAFLNAFIFAVIHPQGPIVVPVLMSLAIGFTLSREWRNSLVAPMISHALHNGLIMSFALFVLT